MTTRVIGRRAFIAGAALALSVPAWAQPLTMSAVQRQRIRAAAAHYRNITVEVVLEAATARERAFGRQLQATLRSAGLNASLVSVDRYADEMCRSKPGVRVAYSYERSGAANAIAEALGRANVVDGSVSGCPVPGTNTLRFIVSSR